MPTNTVANATKMVLLATRGFQTVAKLATSSVKINNVAKDVGRIRLRPKLVNWQLSFLFLVAKSDQT